MKKLVLLLIVLLAVLHQDFWWRYDHRTLVLGFLPVSLAYHAAVSIVASVLWGLACVYLWPKDVDVVEGICCGYPECGERNLPEAHFCARCGRPLSLPSGAAHPS